MARQLKVIPQFRSFLSWSSSGLHTKHMQAQEITYDTIGPGQELSALVESFWMLANPSGTAKQVVVLPDGRFDIFFAYSDNEPYHVTLMGLENEPSQAEIAPGTVMFAVSFKLLAVEYLPGVDISALFNGAAYLPTGFWGITVNDLSDFKGFCAKITAVLTDLLQKDIDDRKRRLFDLVYASRGTLPVKDLSEQAHWSSRQINRYFAEKFGIPLKAYCNILRFRDSFSQLRDGKLFPEDHFTDQAHFIREVKKFSGVIPKELAKNTNDRFIQFSTLPKP